MYKKNELTNIIQKLYITDDIKSNLLEIFDSKECINSYIVYGIHKDGNLVGWEIHYNLSQTNKFNKLKFADIVDELTEKLNDSRQNNVKDKVICHKQPELVELIKQRKPLIIHLAKEQHNRWNFLEMEDLIQMCNLVICDLYYKNYYVHKNLLYRCFNNYVLLHIRKRKGLNSLISLETAVKQADDDNEILLKDTLVDTVALNEQDDKDNEEVQYKILQEVKEIVIDFIGPRQYDQLLREYSNKQTTNWSRKLMQTIKAHLFEMGISSKSFDKYYN